MSLPWGNTWFVLAVYTGVLALALMGYDLSGNLHTTPSQNSPPTSYNPPPQNPDSNSNPPQAPTDNTPPPTQPNYPETSLSYPAVDSTWENSLNMTFRPAGTPGVLVSIYDTRVSDFQAFVDATHYDATAGVYSLTESGWGQNGANWSNPGFSFRNDDAVVGVNWYDANAFCQWLTKKEHDERRIGPHQIYRLPTDQEWSAAAGSAKYPWGNQWPPPLTAGNFLRHGDGISNRSLLPGTDQYAYASPVGAFNANDFGLYDMSGNVWQWVQDWYRVDMSTDELRQRNQALNNDGGGQTFKVMRGASYIDSVDIVLLTSTHSPVNPNARQTNFGFRCVLVVRP